MAIYLNTTPDPEPKLILGPHTRREIELRIRELEGRHRRVRSDNRSGHPGVSWHKPRGKWCARIVANGQRIHLGYFDSLEGAVACRSIMPGFITVIFARNKRRMKNDN